MKEITQFEKHAVEIWRRPRQRHMHLRVRPDGVLRVTCNKRTAKRDILTFIRESEGFINKCLRQWHERRAQFPVKTFTGAEQFLYLGRYQPLQIIWSWNTRLRVNKVDEAFEMVAPLQSTPMQRQLAWHKFLHKHAHEFLAKRIRVFAAHMQLFPQSLSIRGPRTRWGSCSSNGRLSLNWKLLAAPPEVIDYVVVHELAHLQFMNHSPQFWALVAEHFPAYTQAKRWLIAHQSEIAIQFQKISKDSES